jgi:hypothetical protein
LIPISENDIHIAMRKRKTDIHHHSEADDLRARLEVPNGGTFYHPATLIFSPCPPQQVLLGQWPLAELEWIPSKKPRRDTDALHEAAGSAPHAVRDFNRQVAELQVRIAILNGYTALGVPVTKAVG